MSGIPEGVATVTGEGRDLEAAVRSAAEALGVEPRRVKYQLDMAHFRSAAGRSLAVKTVKLIGWAISEEEAGGVSKAAGPIIFIGE